MAHVDYYKTCYFDGTVIFSQCMNRRKAMTSSLKNPHPQPFAIAKVGCETPTSFSDRGCGEGPTTTRNHIVVKGWKLGAVASSIAYLEVGEVNCEPK